MCSQKKLWKQVSHPDVGKLVEEFVGDGKLLQGGEIVAAYEWEGIGLDMVIKHGGRFYSSNRYLLNGADREERAAKIAGMKEWVGSVRMNHA